MSTPAARPLGISPARQILDVRHGLQMPWVTATPDATKMIQLQAVWDSADEALVCNSMGVSLLPGDAHVRIAFLAQSPFPQPATVGIDIDGCLDPIYR